MTVGARIRQARAAKNLTRPQLAELSGVKYPTLAGLENGDQKKSTELHALAAALSVSVQWLATGKEGRPSSDAPESHTSQASNSLRPTGRTLAIAAGALIRFLARRNMDFDVTRSDDADLLLAVEAEYEASRTVSDADFAFGAALADLVTAHEAKRNARSGRGSEPADGPARKKVR